VKCGVFFMQTAMAAGYLRDYGLATLPHCHPATLHARSNNASEDDNLQAMAGPHPRIAKA